jgi:hypothetical protein
MKFAASALLLLAAIPSVAAGARGVRQKNDIPDEEQTNHRALSGKGGKGGKEGKAGKGGKGSTIDVSNIALYTLFLMPCIIQIP